MLSTSTFMLKGSSRASVMKGSKITCYFSSLTPKHLSENTQRHTGNTSSCHTVHRRINLEAEEKKKKNITTSKYQYQACPTEMYYEIINSLPSAFLTPESNKETRPVCTALKSGTPCWQGWKMGDPGGTFPHPVIEQKQSFSAPGK